MTRPLICLCMIVKNEAHVLRRCFDSVLPLIDSYAIVDTGSSDGTIDFVRRYFEAAGLPGKLASKKWRGFAGSRNDALDLAASVAGDYTLMIDADDVMVGGDNDDWPPDPEMAAALRETGMWPDLFAADAWNLRFDDHGISYERPQLLRVGSKIRYRGVLHEFLNVHDAPRIGDLVYKRLGGGARSLVDLREKYLGDALILEEAISRLDAGLDPEDQDLRPRYLFYRAQSLKDAGEPERALHAYLERSRAAGWNQETFQARYEAAKLQEALWEDPSLVRSGIRTDPFTNLEAVRRGYFETFALRPSRAEPLYRLARNYAITGHDALAWIYARAAFELPRPSDVSFVEDNVYTYLAAWELAMAAWAIGRADEARLVLRQIRANEKAPQDIREAARLESERLIDQGPVGPV